MDGEMDTEVGKFKMLNYLKLFSIHLMKLSAVFLPVHNSSIGDLGCLSFSWLGTIKQTDL